MKQAVFFDIDGTLAIRRFIPPSAETAVRSLRENGTLVFICTGRNASYVRHHFHAYADGFICANGRYAFYNGRILYDHPIELSLLQKAREITLGSGGGNHLLRKQKRL
ncbi:MAG: HAD hydrolase family protein [Solobacterium sp.]|nr:HAD hydrolase family protein [Solobacterium sp.]